MKIKSLLTIIALCLIVALAGCGVAKKDAAPEAEAVPNAEAADNQFAGSVWKGTNKDYMYEFLLEFVNNDTVYLLQMLDGEVEQAEKGSYSVTGEEIDFQSITLVENESYDSGAQMISTTLQGAGLQIHFRPSEEALMDQKTLDSYITEDQKADNNAGRTYVLEGWPDEVPMPDFGGEIASDKSGKSSGSASRTIRFQNIDPDKVQPYLDALVAAGFEVIEQKDILIEEETDENGNPQYEAMVDENGNPFYTHRFEAVNGEIVHYDDFDLSRLESGYAISVGYTLQKQYDKATGQFIGNPYVRLVLYIGVDNQ